MHYRSSVLAVNIGNLKVMYCKLFVHQFRRVAENASHCSDQKIHSSYLPSNRTSTILASQNLPSLQSYKICVHVTRVEFYCTTLIYVTHCRVYF